MPKAKKTKISEKQRQQKTLARLKPSEAQIVLQRILDAHSELKDEAEEIPRSVISDVSFGDVADEVEQAVICVDEDELNGRAGKHSWGYTSPDEAAQELLEEAIEPFLEDMQRQIDLSLEKEALEICKGIVLGLYNLREEKDHYALGWSPDFPGEAADWTIGRWYRGSDHGQKPIPKEKRKRPKFPMDFVNEYVPEWAFFIKRVLKNG